MLISKELLSKVLNRNILKIKIFSNCVGYFYDEKYDEINIFELAHKCKEWLIEQTDNDIEIRSNKDVSIVSVYIKEEADFHFEYADMEIEAIFKACEWILKNKETKC